MPFKKYQITRRDAGQALIDVVAARTSLSRKKAKQLIDSRNVFVNGKRVWMARHILKNGDTVEIPDSIASSGKRDDFKVLFRDNDIMIVDKPLGMLSNGANSLESALRRVYGNKNLQAVHRLDRNTSGCLVFAVDADVKNAMIELFRGHEVVKIYHAVVAGMIEEKEMTLKQRIDDKTAESRVRVLDSNKLATHVSVSIDTGRTHQIRKHLHGIGHPVLGDSLYFSGEHRITRDIRAPRQMLHASKIIFKHPRADMKIRCESPLPGDFRECLKVLRLT